MTLVTNKATFYNVRSADTVKQTVYLTVLFKGNVGGRLKIHSHSEIFVYIESVKPTWLTGSLFKLFTSWFESWIKTSHVWNV